MSIYSALKNNAVEDAEDKPTFLSLKPLYLSTPVNVVPTYTTNIVTFVPQFSAFNMMIFLIYIPIIVSEKKEALCWDHCESAQQRLLSPPSTHLHLDGEGRSRRQPSQQFFSGCSGGGSLALIHTIMICWDDLNIIHLMVSLVKKLHLLCLL